MICNVYQRTDFYDCLITRIGDFLKFLLFPLHFFQLSLDPVILLPDLRNQRRKFMVRFLRFTVIKIQILDPADESILDGLKKLCEKYDTMFSTTNTDSELYKLNHANGQPFTVSSETANLIQEGIHYSELSGGAFDLTIEPVSALWDFKADKPTVPSSDAIAQAVSHVDYTKVDIQDNTVTLEDPEAGIDLGAIAKGYIADQVKT